MAKQLNRHQLGCVIARRMKALEGALEGSKRSQLFKMHKMNLLISHYSLGFKFLLQVESVG